MTRVVEGEKRDKCVKVAIAGMIKKGCFRKNCILLYWFLVFYYSSVSFFLPIVFKEGVLHKKSLLL